MRNRSCKLNFNSEHFQNSTQKRAFVELWLWFPSFLVDFQGCSARGITDTATRECTIGCRHGGKLKTRETKSTKIHGILGYLLWQDWQDLPIVVGFWIFSFGWEDWLRCLVSLSWLPGWVLVSKKVVLHRRIKSVEVTILVGTSQ